jgi:hypothetical protein
MQHCMMCANPRTEPTPASKVMTNAHMPMGTNLCNQLQHAIHPLQYLQTTYRLKMEMPHERPGP